LAATNLVEGIGEESMNTIMSTRRYHQKGAYLASNTVGVEYKRTPVAFVHFMIKFREGMRAERMTMTRLSIALNTIMITYHVIYTYYELIIPLQLKDALQMFQGIMGSSFSYIHCWWMLHHEKKWNDWLASLTQKDKEATVTASPAEQSLEAKKRDKLLCGRWGETKQRDNGVKAAFLPLLPLALRYCKKYLWIGPHTRSAKKSIRESSYPMPTRS
jgi:hypothetical protein